MSFIPDFLKTKLIEQYGNELAEKILKGYDSKRKVTLRVNSLKSSIEEIKSVLDNEKIEYRDVDWYKNALIIENATEEDIKALDIFESGKIYMQSLSSMMPPICMGNLEGLDILDMCAAPGGKTTEMAALSNNKAHITACEMNKIRIERLKYNIEKQGASVYVMSKDSRQIDDFFKFDKILLDSPCSGSGTLNSNDKNVEKYFTPNLIEKSVKSQRELLKKAVKILKPGGELIYSTCSILKEENEENVREVLKNKNMEIIAFDEEGFIDPPFLPVEIEGTMCVCPTDLYEGFYIARFIKK